VTIWICSKCKEDLMFKNGHILLEPPNRGRGYQNHRDILYKNGKIETVEWHDEEE